MKNSKFTLIAVAFLLVASFLTGFAQSRQEEQPKLTVSLTAQEWNALLQIVDNSNAPHATVTAFQKEIVAQLEKQIQAQKATEAQKEPKK